MTGRVLRVGSIERVVADLEASARFYVEALGFAERARDGGHVSLVRGRQGLVLRPGQAAQGVAAANDQAFQHLALPVVDIAAAFDRLRPFGPASISRGGPQRLPAGSGGATAFKFRDPDGHPLELIQFADPAPGGIDHSAITVADVERSIAFYRDQLGFTVAARQRNHGAEQDRLDGLDGVSVEVVALQPDDATPHVELLAYQSPPVQPSPGVARSTLLVLTVTGLAVERRLVHDPDGHALLLERA